MLLSGWNVATSDLVEFGINLHLREVVAYHFEIRAPLYKSGGFLIAIISLFNFYSETRYLHRL